MLIEIIILTAINPEQSPQIIKELTLLILGLITTIMTTKAIQKFAETKNNSKKNNNNSNEL